MKRTTMMLMTLVLFAMLAPTTALADDATNEAITGLSIEFTGEGEETLATITIYVNDNAAENEGGIVADVWVDKKDASHELTNITIYGTKTEKTITWPIETYPEGMHTLIVVFDEDTLDEVSHDNKADNELSLVFGTQDAKFADLIEMYGSIQYFWTQSTRNTMDGMFAFLDELPLAYWIAIIVFIIIVILLILRLRKKGKLGKKAAYRTAYVPYNYARKGYQNHVNYRNEFR
jgi:hypothetical protein